MRSDSLCSQSSAGRLRALLSLLKVRRDGIVFVFDFVLFSCIYGNRCCHSGLDHLPEHIVLMEATRLPSKKTVIQEAVFKFSNG